MLFGQENQLADRRAKLSRMIVKLFYRQLSQYGLHAASVRYLKSKDYH